jgi:transcriptional activator
MDLPKLPPDTIVRHHVDEWLDRNATRRVRIVAGQPGCGKTVAVAAWARRRSASVRWITVGGGATETDMRALLGTLPDGELVIDGADRASAGGRAFLAQVAHDAAASVRFIYLVRTPRMFEETLSNDPAALLDATALRFEDAEIERFCAAHGVAATAKERQRFHAATGGWAFAVAGTVRYAAGLGGTLGAAFPRWLATARPFIAQLVDEAAADTPLAATAFDRVARGVATGTDDVREASQAAFFVERSGETYVVNPVVASLRGDGRGSARPAPAVLHMFGRFRVTIGSGEVCFGRRRARSLVQFLALRDDGTATRAELLREFWPDMERRAAADALVNTCSTIRRAIAQCVGRDAVDEYFTVHRNTIALRLGNVVSTANRFSTHVKVASAAYDRGDLDAAVAHWSAALRLHSAPLLSGEPSASWISAAQREYDEAALNAMVYLRMAPSAVTAHAVRDLTA